ncbi:MAG: hypothetical protein V4548_10840 [Bacteroidota bacterium]
MRITIPNNFFHQFLFTLCVAVTYLNIFELTIFIWTLTALISLSNKYSVSFLKLNLPFLIILLTAFIVMLTKDYENYFIIRDITYLIKPIVGFFIGYQLYKKNMNNAFNLILNTALFIAIIHIIVVVIAFIFQNARTLNDIRLYGGYFSDYEVYALIILIFYKNFDIDFSTKKAKVYTILVAISFVLYFARTNFIQFVILYLAIKGYFTITRKSLTIIFSIILTTLICYSTILYINPKRNGDGVEAFLYKIKIAPLEPFKTKINREDYIDFNDNYRSFENIMTIRQVSRDGYWNVIFGKGLGSQIDLKQKVYLGDMELRFISILHNGFMIVFLKSGLFGIFVYFYSIYYFFKKRSNKLKIQKNINLLFLGTGVFLFLSNWVFLGFYNLIDTKTIFLGFLIAYSEKIKNEIQE